MSKKSKKIYIILTILGLFFIAPPGLQRFYLGLRFTGLFFLVTWAYYIYAVIANDTNDTIFTTQQAYGNFAFVYILQLIDLFRFKGHTEKKSNFLKSFTMPIIDLLYKGVYLGSIDAIKAIKDFPSIFNGLSKNKNKSNFPKNIKDDSDEFIISKAKQENTKYNSNFTSFLFISYSRNASLRNYEIPKKEPGVQNSTCIKCHRILPRNYMKQINTRSGTSIGLGKVLGTTFSSGRIYYKKAWICNTCQSLRIKKLTVIYAVPIIIFSLVMFSSSK